MLTPQPDSRPAPPSAPASGRPAPTAAVLIRPQVPESMGSPVRQTTRTRSHGGGTTARPVPASRHCNGLVSHRAPCSPMAPEWQRAAPPACEITQCVERQDEWPSLYLAARSRSGNEPARDSWNQRQAATWGSGRSALHCWNRFLTVVDTRGEFSAFCYRLVATSFSGMQRQRSVRTVRQRLVSPGAIAVSVFCVSDAP